MRCLTIAVVFVGLLGLAASKGNKVKEELAKQEAEVATTDAEAKGKSRSGKVFSLFNVVHFQNGGCRSQSTFSGVSGSGSTNRNGTCFTTEECSNKGGTASGNCAAGFGVCCIFLITTSGTTISQNCTYIRNPGFPSALTGTGATTYTVKKSMDAVCKLRLDFETFSIAGVSDSAEFITPTVAGGDCLDTFDVTVNTAQDVPTICGVNTGQHMYIDLGNDPSDTAMLTFNFDVLVGQGAVAAVPAVTTPPTAQFIPAIPALTAYAGSRTWEIKVTQIPCYGPCATYQVPQGCLQYNTGLTGTLNTFNYQPATSTQTNLQNQDYNICIRQEEGYCCIQYAPCAADGIDAFSLDTRGAATATSPTAVSAIDSGCSGDYIDIAGSNANCNQGGSRVPVVNKYCGLYFNAIAGLAVSSTVCDCTQPFNIQIHTDALPDSSIVTPPLTLGAPPTVTPVANALQSTGVCLTWMQIPCAS